MPSLQGFRGKFPTEQNRELFSQNREFSRENREFYQPEFRASVRYSERLFSWDGSDAAGPLDSSSVQRCKRPLDMVIRDSRHFAVS
jgi:hypothetical protein